MIHTATETDYKVLTITSPGFKGNCIPRKYTCEGDNVNPPLEIEGIPQNAKSLVLIMEDPDAPRHTWLHWLAWNLPVTEHIQEDAFLGQQGTNDFGEVGYKGPCPPSGTHRYHFKVYALNELIDINEGSTRREVEHAMDDHVLAYGELIGLYRRNG